MFFNSFEGFYQKYKELINKNNNCNNSNEFKEEDLKLFWLRHCYMLDEYATTNDGINYANRLNGHNYQLSLLENKIIIRPSFNNFSTYGNYFVICIGNNLKCLEIRDRNLIVESYNPNHNYMTIDIYDEEATEYFCDKTNASLEKIDNIEKYIGSERLLPDKTVNVYGPFDDGEIVFKTFKMGELISEEVVKCSNDIQKNYLFLTTLDIDNLLSDLNNNKTK